VTVVGTVSSAKEYFDTLSQRFVASAAKGVNAIFQFELSGEGGGTYHVIVRDGAMQVGEGAAPEAPSTTLKMEAKNYVKMVNGELNGMMAVMKGQLKVTGNVMLAQKMQAMFPQKK
jgi:putative sterol carrier protein